MRRSVWTVGLAAVAAVVAAAPAAAAPAVPPPPPGVCAPTAVGAPFGANTNRPGVVDLFFFGGGGARVDFYECLPGGAVALGSSSEVTRGFTPLRDAVAWRCDRRTRIFAAAATLADGTFSRGLSSVRTPSCARRFSLRLPRRAALGRAVRVRVVDGFALGGARGRLCARSPQRRRTCRGVVLAPAQRVGSWSFRPRSAGTWHVELDVAGRRARATVAVGRGEAAALRLPRVLATGDSTMQGVADVLADELAGAAEVTGEVRPGMGLSDVAGGWPAVAREQVARLRPRVTVVSIGAAEGFAMQTPAGTSVTCCGAPWTAEYARRAGAMMRRYASTGDVVFLTIVAPRDPDRVPIVAAVNAAILRAAAGLPRVRVLRMDELFSPHGYQEVIRYRGRDVDVREPDGVHLNVAGAAIAAHEVAGAVRALLG